MSGGAGHADRLHAVLVADAAFAASERALLNRIEIGLADDGVNARLALPETTESHQAFVGLADPLLYRPGSFGPFLGLSAARLAAAVSSSFGSDTRRVVHAFGGGSWRFAAELARLLDAALVLEVWRMGLCRRARRFESVPRGVVLAAPGPAVERALISEQTAHAVRLTPWGGAIEPDARAPFQPGKRAATVLVGRARDVTSYRAAFEAVVAAGAEQESLVLVDEHGVERAGIWGLAKSLGILERTTVVHRLEDRRDLVLRADLLVHPDARGEYRSLLLDAMGAGLPVVAANDPGFSPLLDGRTARCVAGSSIDAWSDAISELVRTPSKARELGASARRYVGDNLRKSDHIASILNLYEGITQASAHTHAGEDRGTAENIPG